MPDATSRAAMFDKWWSFGSTIIAPATLLSTLLFYFGYVSSRAQFRYFGLDVDTVGLSTQDYVMRSPQALLVPLLALSLGGAGLLILHLAVRRHPPRASAVRVFLIVSLSALLAGVGLIMGYAVLGDWPLYPLVTPLLLAGGSAGVLYGMRLPGGLLRLLRTPRVFRYSRPFEGLARAFRENGLLFTFAFSLLGIAVLVGGTSLYLIERSSNPSISSLADGLWWALVTITTVGFGDISPVTAVGRVVGAVMMVLGMFTLALFAGIVGHTLLNAVLGIREEQFRMSNYIDHVVICGYDPGARMLLDVLMDEIDVDDTPVVVFAEGDRPRDLPAELNWVSGDPTKESELAKVRLSHATAAILVGARAVVPQQADARTLLTAFTLRSYLSRDEEAQRRRRPLYVVAEILDSENVEHARTAGADEVIETTRLGFSLVAHAIAIPGTGSIVSRVATAGAHSIWVGRLEPRSGAPWPTTMGALRQALKAEYDVLLLGVRDGDPAARSESGSAGEDRINPPDDTPVPAGAALVYLADRPRLPAA